MELSYEDVLHILKLIEQSPFDYLELQTEQLKLVVQKQAHPAVPRRDAAEASSGAVQATAPQEVPTVDVRPLPGDSQEVARASAAGVKASLPVETPPAASGENAAVYIQAPMVGTFYVAPEPGAPPFVEVGARVEPETTVGLIEVMKVFNAVKAGVRGVLVERLVQDGQFVEYGQPLFRVRPESVSAAA